MGDACEEVRERSVSALLVPPLATATVAIAPTAPTAVVTATVAIAIAIPVTAATSTLAGAEVTRGLAGARRSTPRGARASRLLVLRLVHPDRSSVQILAIQRAHGRVTGRGIREGDESEAARASRLSIRDDLRLDHFTEPRERFTETIVGGAPAETTNKQFLRHLSLSDFLPALRQARNA